MQEPKASDLGGRMAAFWKLIRNVLQILYRFFLQLRCRNEALRLKFQSFMNDVNFT